MGPGHRASYGCGFVRRVNHGVSVANKVVDQLGVTDVTLHERESIGAHTRERSTGARIGIAIYHRHVVVGWIDDVAHEVRADEPGAAGQGKGHPTGLAVLDAMTSPSPVTVDD